MEFHCDFTKKTISKSWGEFLLENLTEDSAHIKRIIAGKKLVYQDANTLLLHIMTAMMGNDGNKEEYLMEETEAQKEKEKTDTQDPGEGTSRQENIVPISTQEDPTANITVTKKCTTHLSDENFCRFYSRGACKHMKDCKFEHPKMCKKFTKHGNYHKKFNLTGCEGNCGKFHPNTCRESLRKKECSRENCRFFHLKGTSANPNKKEKASPRVAEDKITSDNKSEKSQEKKKTTSRFFRTARRQS